MGSAAGRIAKTAPDACGRPEKQGIGKRSGQESKGGAGRMQPAGEAGDRDAQAGRRAKAAPGACGRQEKLGIGKGSRQGRGGRKMNERLLSAARFFTRETEIMDGMYIAAGRGDRVIEAWDGRDAGPEILFDLASVTKLFTGLCLMRLEELGGLDIRARITAYDPRFIHLGSVTVEQLMGFQVPLRTPRRLDACGSREEALACLREVRVAEMPKASPEPSRPGSSFLRLYSDIPAMVLKYVAEAASGMPFYACVRELILRPAGMAETAAGIRGDQEGRCPLYGPEYRMIRGQISCRGEIRRGVPHDPKAAVLQGDGEDLCGHAGLFSTGRDMIRFCRAVLEGRVVRRESLKRMAVNRTGRRLPGGGWSQYLGYQCYTRHPEQYYSEIPADMGEGAFGIGGFTGNHVSIDPAGDRFSLFLGNRVRGRLTVLIPEAGRSYGDYGLRADGSGRIRLADGTEAASSVNYVHHKDERVHGVIREIWAESGGSGGSGGG